MKPIYFDVDGCLNQTPQTPVFWFDPACLRRLLSLDRPLICISYWRHFPAEVAKLGIDCALAPRGPKIHAVPAGAFVIDDDRTAYAPDCFVYAPDGHVGLTDQDVIEIRGLLT